MTRLVKKSQLQKYQVDIFSPTAVAELQTFYFPGWQVWVDDQAQPIDPTRDPLLGRIQVDLTSGSHTLVARFTNTPVRTLGNTLSLVSWLLMIYLFVRVINLKSRGRVK